MKLQEYQEKAKRTVADLGSDKLNLSHMVMGMCTELPELEDALRKQDNVNVGEELADIYWYIANYGSLRGYNLELFKPMEAGAIGVEKLYYDIATLQDIVKKYIAYDKAINIEEERELLRGIVENINHFFIYKRLNRDEFLQKNIDKLKARYPEKFTEHDAVNRDLDKERKILES
jgi:hypothetical protein